MKKYRRMCWFVFSVFSAVLLPMSQVLAEEHSLVFVHIGKDLPSHLKYSIAQARLFNPDIPMFLLANEAAISKDSGHLDVITIPIESLKVRKNHEKYEVKAKTSGFWRYTLERFLVLDDFIQQYKKFDVFHVENDVMIYFNLKQKLEVFQNNYSNMIATVFDCDERSVPSFVYVATPRASNKLSKFIASRAEIDTTDMETLSLFKDSNYGSRGHLPILIPSYADDYPMTNIFKQTAKNSKPFSNCLDDFQMIFDAAALGQFLGGIDPILGHSKAGFLGEASVFLPMYFRFSWEKDDYDRWIPYIAYKDIKYPIANLHIHSKALSHFSSVNDEMPELPSVSFSSLPFNHIQPKKFR